MIFLEHLSQFAKQYGQIVLREQGYSHLLFSHLQKEYGDVFLNGVGLLVSSIEPTMGTAQKTLVSKYMKKSKDLYPDLIMFPKRVVDLELDCLKRFENLSTFACPLILIEWKFTNSFPRDI